MKDFQNLNVWVKAHALTLAVYRATKCFPKEETYGLISQIRRSSASIPANIAEGCGRSGDSELGRFLQIAAGSASALEYHILLAHDLQFLNDASYSQLSSEVFEVKKMLSSLIGKLKADR
ncbi:MAG: four helix bundle protein [Terriglobia bacterium]